MIRQKVWLLLALLTLVLVVLLACAPNASPTPSATPTAKPTSTASSATAKPSPTAEPTTTAKSTLSAASVSFAGKTVTVIVPAAAGGGADLSARIFAMYLGKYLPGNPSVIVRNIPAGGTILGSNYAYASKPDGMTLLAGTGGSMLSQLVGLPAVQYDFNKMTVLIGSSASYVMYLWSSIIKRPEDILTAKGIILGTTTTGVNAYMYVVSREVLGFPVERSALAYGGSGDAVRAFLAGEINMTSLQTRYDAIDALVAKGEVIPLFQGGVLDDKGDLIKDPAVPPEILTVKELYQKLYNKAPSGMAWDAYRNVLAAGLAYNKSWMLPPGASDAIKKAYWDSSASLAKDPGFLKEEEALLGPGVWQVGDAADKSFKLNFAVKPEVVTWIRSTLPKYGVSVQ